MRGLQEIAPALTRAWVEWYTNGMPAELRDVRRAEVDSDLWERCIQCHTLVSDLPPRRCRSLPLPGHASEPGPR